MLNDRIDYETVNQRVEDALKRAQRRNMLGLFLANVLIYAVFMFLGWILIPNVSSMQVFLSNAVLATFIMLSVGWGTGVFLHGVSTALALGAMNQSLRERVTARELQREIHRLGLAAEHEKPKRRQQRLALTEDGEMLEIADDEELLRQQR